VRWIQSQAFVERIYTAENVASVLCALGLLAKRETSLDWSGLTLERVLECWPVAVCLPDRSWFECTAPMRRKTSNQILRTVHLPSGCVGRFIGKAGSGIKTVESEMQKQTAKHQRLADISVRLQWVRASTSLRLELTWQECQNAMYTREVMRCASACADALASNLQAFASRFYLDLLEQHAQRREQRALASEEFGRKFHEERLARRAMQKSAKDRSFTRGVELPAGDISRRMTAGRGQLAQRRRAMKCEKRQRMLSAWAALEAGIPRQGCRQVRSDAKRLLRHASRCLDEEMAEDALTHIQASCHKGRPERQPAQSQRTSPRRAQRLTFGRGRGERSAKLLAAGSTGGAF